MAINNISRHLEHPINKRGDFLIVDLNESNGNRVVDIRRWYTADDDSVKPTPKGVSIPVDLIGEVVRGILDAAGIDPATIINRPSKPTVKKAAPAAAKITPRKS